MLQLKRIITSMAIKQMEEFKYRYPISTKGGIAWHTQTAGKRLAENRGKLFQQLLHPNEVQRLLTYYTLIMHW